MTAYELRMNYANSLRTDKTRSLAVKATNYLRTLDTWSEITQINGIEIGGKIKFIKKTFCGESVNFAVTKATLFAVGSKGRYILIRRNSKTESVKISQITI